MSGRTNWSDKPLPSIIRRRYPSSMREQLAGAIEAGEVVWRFTGSSHFEVRQVATGRRLSLTTGPTASDPSYAARCRSFLRQGESVKPRGGR